MSLDKIREFLKTCGLPAGDLQRLPDSQLRFLDGGQYRIEIPGIEGPRALEAVVEEAYTRQVPVHRVSKGSGLMLQTAEEVRRMVRLGAERGVEVNLSVGPPAPCDISAQQPGAADRTQELSLRGADQLVYALEEVRYACGSGIRSVRVSDLGVLWLVGKMKGAGLLPGDLVVKASTLMGHANPASIRLLEDLGATSIDIPSDSTLSQLAALRAAVTVPLDFHVEAPDTLGGVLRYYELAEVIRICAPVYVKVGLCPTPEVNPAGTHLEATHVALARERVRRAQIALELLERHYPQAVLAPPRAADLGLPVPTSVEA